MKLDIINGAHLKQIFSTGSSFLEQRRKEVDLLNVFPVPDGDTGTNMALTARAAALKALAVSGDSLDEVAAAASMGSLMGARGNSGVILSQFFRGWSTVLAGKKEARPKELALAFQAGVDTAYKAVMKPVEGTILTVGREGARGAFTAAKDGKDILGVLRSALKESSRALEKTPDLLPALKEAGVVDAGGKGLIVFLEGALAALTGEKQASDLTYLEKIPVFEPELSVEGGLSGEILYQYCTEFVLKGEGLILEEIKKALAGEGDCLLVVGTGEVAKIHIHTNHPGNILEYCLNLGSLHQVQINNMQEQHENLVNHEREQKPIGVLAVAAGDGFGEIFTNLGADVVIQGGQTMNPSTQDLVRGVERIFASCVFILPNNKNIILTASQVKELTSKEITVIPTMSMTQGIAALLAFNFQGDGLSNEKNMLKALSQVVTGEVTRAVRDSMVDGLEIKEGQYLGLIDGDIALVGEDREMVLLELLAKAKDDHHEIVTLYYGQEVNSDEAGIILENLNKDFQGLEFEIHYGGQPLYEFLFSIE